MLFGKRKETEELTEIKRMLTQSAEQSDLAQARLEVLQKQTDIVQKQNEALQNQLTEQTKQQAETEKQLRRQSASFEDLLDEFQTQKEEQERENLQENALVTLVCTCREQLELLENQIRKDTSLSEEKRMAWENQFVLMDKECQNQMKLCGIIETGCIGEEADYRFYEILSTLDTTDVCLSGTVAEVYAKGRIYQGKVLKKAQAAIYKYQQQ